MLQGQGVRQGEGQGTNWKTRAKIKPSMTVTGPRVGCAVVMCTGAQDIMQVTLAELAVRHSSAVHSVNSLGKRRHLREPRVGANCSSI